VDIATLLPTHAIRHKEQVLTLPPPEKVLEKHLFDFQHIQHMSCHVSPADESRSSKAKERPVWQALDIDDWQHAKPTFKTLPYSLRSALITKLATNMKNIIKGKAFNKMLRYVVRLLLRVWLSPIREARHQEKLKEHAKVSKAKKAAAAAAAADPLVKLNKEWHRVLKSQRRQYWELTKKIWKVPLTDERQAAYQTRIKRLRARLASPSRNGSMVEIDFFFFFFRSS
jgi:hypothetical protein